MNEAKKLSERVRDIKMAFGYHDNRRTDVETLAVEIAALEKRLAEAGWQPIETAPKDGTELLLCSIHLYSPRTGCWATYHPNAMGKAGWRTAPICGDKLNPTHWMPLPPPPQESTHD